MVKSTDVVKERERQSKFRRVATASRRSKFGAPRHAIASFHWLRVSGVSMIAT